MVYKQKSLLQKFMNGGFGYGVLCLPYTIIELILMVIFPPIYVVFKQVTRYNRAKDKGKDVYLLQYLNFREIITNIILTSLFYIPGFVHALTLKTKDCGLIT